RQCPAGDRPGGRPARRRELEVVGDRQLRSRERGLTLLNLDALYNRDLELPLRLFVVLAPGSPALPLWNVSDLEPELEGSGLRRNARDRRVRGRNGQARGRG